MILPDSFTTVPSLSAFNIASGSENLDYTRSGEFEVTSNVTGSSFM